MDNNFNENQTKEQTEGQMGSLTGEQMVSPVQVKKGGLGMKLYALFVTLLAGVAIIAAMYLYSDNEKSKKKQTENEQVNATVENESKEPNESDEESGESKEVDEATAIKNTIRDYMENGKGTMAMLRELFPENVVVFDSNKYIFLDINEKLKKNTIENENIKQLENGELVYEENGNQISHKGIDVSKFQGTIDWNKVAESGVEFAIIRVGYRGYGTGAIVQDETAIQNIEGALNADIKVGVYFFSQAITVEEAVEEAEFVLNIIKKYDITYPVVFDTEEILNEDTRAESLSKEERTELAIAFCERVKKDGYTPAIYANLRWFTMSLDMEKLESYDKWYAYYDSSIYFPYRISMWQYTESGQIDGITGTVDMNISFKDWETEE